MSLTTASPVRKRSGVRIAAIAEIVWILLLMLIAVHFLAERIAVRSIPHGDEGSWLSVAAEFSQGNGFTTRWLEHGFLKPYALPRPDDFRFPGLVCILAGAFKLFGIGYPVALWTVALIFLVFGLVVYGIVRRVSGATVACATLPLVYFSPLHYIYATEVYSETLFGIVLAAVLFFSWRFKPDARAWWIGSGASIGLLYLIRPNAVLFAGALAVYGLWAVSVMRVRWRFVAMGLCAMIVIMLPWLLRTWSIFGNPFHLAGSAGLLRVAAQEPLTYSLSDFTRMYGAFYFVKTTLCNIPLFFTLLHQQEHGLELLPLLFCLVGLARRKPFYNGMVLLSFLCTLLACFYVSSGYDWAGVRYFSSFLPFVYAYGISQMVWLIGLLIAKFAPQFRRAAFVAAAAVMTGALIFPVYYPHRYYERYYRKMPAGKKEFPDYYDALRRNLGNNRFYYAGSLAQINFATGLNCVGMQWFFDEKEIRRAQKAFHPGLVALRPKERCNTFFTRVLSALQQDGCTLTEETMPDSFALFITIKEP